MYYEEKILWIQFEHIFVGQFATCKHVDLVEETRKWIWTGARASLYSFSCSCKQFEPKKSKEKCDYNDRTWCFQHQID